MKDFFTSFSNENQFQRDQILEDVSKLAQQLTNVWQSDFNSLVKIIQQHLQIFVSNLKLPGVKTFIDGRTSFMIDIDDIKEKSLTVKFQKYIC